MMADIDDFELVFIKLNEAIKEQDMQNGGLKISDITDEVKALKTIVNDISAEQEPTTFTRA
jgi:hypothetical protein